MIGTAIGAAIEGMRPIIEMQFADFSSIALNQIVNHAGHACIGGRRSPARSRFDCRPAARRAAARFTARAWKRLYAHYPGLVVMTPATVEDAYTMLIEAVAIDDPVIFCEHKYLYYHLKADALPTENDADRQSANRAAGARPHHRDLQRDGARSARRARQEFGAEGCEIEVVDLRSIKPLDTDTVLASVARTGRLLCVGESWPWGGVTAEVIARVATEGFHLLDAPPQRLNAKDTPVPYHPNLWSEHRPNAKSIAAKARQILAE